MKQILSTAPGGYLVASSRCEWDEVRAEAAKDSGWMLCYYSFMRPSFREFRFDDSHDYRVDVIDTWNMTIQSVGIFRGKFRISLPAKQYMAIRLVRQ